MIVANISLTLLQSLEPYQVIIVDVWDAKANHEAEVL